MSKSRYPNAPLRWEEMGDAWNSLVRELEVRDSKYYSASKNKWNTANVSTATSINVSTATDTYTANVLGSLIQLLSNKGII